MGCCFSDPYDLPDPQSVAAPRRSPAKVVPASERPPAFAATPTPIEHLRAPSTKNPPRAVAVAPIVDKPPVVVHPADGASANPSNDPVRPSQNQLPPPPPPPSKAIDVTAEQRRPSILRQMLRGTTERTTSDSGSTTVTKAELAEHGRSSPNPWIAVKGRVYDVTGLLNSHPGGKGVLLSNAGKDGTVDFNDSHSYMDLAKHKTVKLIGKLKG